MKIFAIETSCDETSAAIVEGNVGDKKVKLLSNAIASSLSLHAKTGGIIPEVAAREQVKYIIPTILEALKPIGSLEKIDAIAVTYGPGLIGSLLVGVETAKALSYIYKKPIVPVNHLIGHIYANFIENEDIEFPALALVVSGGHTDLVILKKHGEIEWIGGTRDDAAGEAFDKIGRILELPYPGGPYIEAKAKEGNPKKFFFPRPLIDSNDFDFSFSGLKTAALREINKLKENGSLTEKDIDDLCAGVQESIIDVLIKKTLKAAEKYKVKSILLSGGVSANQTLRDEFKKEIENTGIKFFAPARNLSTDNAAMIASAAFFNYKEEPWDKIIADPELYFD